MVARTKKLREMYPIGPSAGVEEDVEILLWGRRTVSKLLVLKFIV